MPYLEFTIFTYAPTSNRADELMNKRLYPSIRATKATVTTRFGALFFI
jgi:hypothetical protein